MGIETQAILAGHVSPDRFVSLLKGEVSGEIIVRDMQRPEYKIVEIARPDGSVTAMHLFLDSWAAEDYAADFSGASTLVTVEFSPQNFSALRAIVAAVGGLVRKAAGDSWLGVQAATP